MNANDQPVSANESAPLPGSTVCDLADKLAREIFSIGDGPTPCRRIEFKGGSYPDKEREQGGLCESSLADALRTALKIHLPNDTLCRPADSESGAQGKESNGN